MNETELSGVAERLFQAFVDHDPDTVRALCAPDARFWQAGRGESDLEATLAGIPSMAARIGDHRYEQVRRLVAPDGFVEQHRVRSTLPDGSELDLEACVVVRVDDAGLVIRLDEYVAPTS